MTTDRPNLKKISNGAAGGTQGFNADYELVLGSVYGARTWQVHSRTGELFPLHAGQIPWERGVNEATCRRHHISGFYSSSYDPKNHQIHECSCGYYAYFDPSGHEMKNIDSESNTRGNYAGGVIRATGKTVIGDKGFRASKAEIVAIYHPGFQPPPQYSAWDRFRFWMTSGSRLGLVVGILLSLLIVLTPAAFAFSLGDTDTSVTNALMLLAYLISALSPVILLEIFRARRDLRPRWEMQNKIAQRIAKRYPGVPTFADAEAMFNQYELRPGGRYESE